MLMSESDKLKIKNRGRFLIQKGYRVSTGQYDVTFHNGLMEIVVFYERYDNHQDILIKFPNRGVCYLHFIALKLGKVNVKDKTPIETLLVYMDYLERYYDKLMNQEYCEKCMEQVWKEVGKTSEIIEVPVVSKSTEESGEKEMNTQNMTETEEERKKGNLYSWISLICFASRTVVGLVIGLAIIMMETISGELEDVSEVLGEVSVGITEGIYLLGGAISVALLIAAVVLVIYVRVKYPKNIFGKVLMWVYIVAFIVYVVLTVAVIIACGIACGACVNECQTIGCLTVERMMLC